MCYDLVLFCTLLRLQQRYWHCCVVICHKWKQRKCDHTPINFYKRQRVSDTSPCVLFSPDFLLVLSLIFLSLFAINQRLVFIFMNDMDLGAKIVS